MDALSLQFGSTLINSERSRVVDRNADAVLSDTVTTINNVNLTVPAVTYSLNLANAAGNKSSIDAKPTLLVYDGQTSKVFSGGTLTYAASGQLSSQSFTKEVGLSLAVTPKFNDNNTVTLTIVTGLETFINTPAAGSFREAVQTDKSSTEIGESKRIADGELEKLAVDLTNQAATAVDLASVPPLIIERSKIERVLMLFEVLRKVDRRVLDQAPADGSASSWLVPGTPIRIQRVAEGDRKGEYLFADETIQGLEDAYARASPRRSLGDECEFEGFRGVVEEIGIRSTSIRLIDGSVITLTNSEFSNMKIRNLGAGRHSFSLEFPIISETKAENIRKFLRDVERYLESDSAIKKGKSSVNIECISASGINVKIFGQYEDINDEFYSWNNMQISILEIIQKNGINIANNFN